MRTRLPVADRLSREDARILKLEHGTIRGHTCKVLVLERSGNRPLPTVDAIREHIAARLDAAVRLRQRIVATPLRIAAPVWLDDPEFDIARHVTPVPLADPPGREALSEIVAGLMARRLDRSRPLWQLDVVERLDDDSMALIWRLHHCLADGTTGMRIGSSVLWSTHPELTPHDASPWVPRADPSALTMIAQALAERGERRSRHAESMLASPSTAPLSRTAIVRELRRSAAPTAIAHRAGASRRVALGSAPLAGCITAAKSIGDSVTLNDVLLAIIAGGVRAWLERGHGPTDGIRVKIPVSLHRDGEGANVGNRDSYFFVDLPVAEPDVRRRALAISGETTERKLDHDADTLYRLGTHPFVARWAMSPRVFTFNVSNVRGPASELCVLGARVRELYSLAEIAQHHVLRVAVISAFGELFLGLCADRDALSGLDTLADGLRRSTDELLALAR